MQSWAQELKRLVPTPRRCHSLIREFRTGASDLTIRLCGSHWIKCLIDLENRTGQAEAIRELITLHRARKIQVFVSAVPQPQNVTGKVVPENSEEFEARLKELGIDDLPSVADRTELSSWGAAVYSAENDGLRDRINSVVQSTVDTLTLTRKERNVICNVDGLAAHIRSGHDIFVTSDQHFRKATRRQALVALGAKGILTPEEALAKVLKHEAAGHKD